MFDPFAFVIGETAIALRRNKSLALAAIVTVALSIYLIAGLAYVGFRASGFLDRVPGRFEMEMNLRRGVTLEDVRRTAKYLRKLPGVANVVWMPADRQYALWRRENPGLAEGLGEESPFAEKFRIRLDDLSRGDDVAATANRMSTVDPENGVVYYREAQNAVAAWIPLLRTLALWTGFVLLGVSTVLILTAIRLTVEARRVEVRVMRLVGASRLVVAMPFVLEGVVQGALGGLLAAVGIGFSQRIVQSRLNDLSLGASLAPFPLLLAFFTLAALGGGYGGFCSLLSLRAPLRSQRD